MNGSDGTTTLARGGRVWRLAATGAALAVLGYGTVAGDDDLFPLGPMVQYAFSIPPDGEIHSLFLEADTAAGARVEVPIEPQYVGIRRAELEGQLGRFIRRPELLQQLAEAHARLRPHDPRLTALHVMTKVVTLRNRVPDRTYAQERVSWVVR
ncbi:hypothetical protein JOL79_09490 [Microbispora sp. RL4-1S]|uniref:Uncharacterized protein n=1 Tax=Microbispora oryzae TaxID=2806554 RepID=A0A940WM83_9ACTN|nr:hypothetical protein [Microbispora oryzae]MBP2704040.1 hypothetical protein [Microbispora oryzae]